MKSITDWRWRLLGLLPLALFIIRWLDYVKWQTPGQMLWSCHLANLLLCLGLFTAQQTLLRVGSLWAILGLLPWAIDMLNTHIIWPVSWLSHLGGAVLGACVLSVIRTQRNTWWQALVWFILVQQFSRWFSTPDLNVNVAHHAYGGAQHWFSSYWQYWVVNTFLAALVLWLSQQGLHLVFKPKVGEQA